MSNDELYEKAVEAATALFNDTSVSPEATKASLQELAGEIETMVDAIAGDM